MRGDNDFTFDFLDSENSPLFEGFYAIYVEAIPPSERKSREKMCTLVARPEYRCTLLTQGTIVLGFAIVFISAEDGLWLLEYMAIDRSRRSLGLGTLLFGRVCQDVARQHGPITGLLEVDSECGNSAGQENRRRRQNFYRRLSCRRVDGLSYILPLDGGLTPPQMDLMVYAPDTLEHVGRVLLEKWLRVLYTKVYDRACNDPRIAVMLHPLGERIKLI